jgi:hypothetical protein
LGEDMSNINKTIIRRSEEIKRKLEKSKPIIIEKIKRRYTKSK